MSDGVVNIRFAGLGGQGVLKASDILAAAAVRARYDVKKSELHGMSQRGGSVTSDVRFGEKVFSPMIPAGEVDFLVVLNADEAAAQEGELRNGGRRILPDRIKLDALESPRCLNVALLGYLSRWLEIDKKHWYAAIRAYLPVRAIKMNLDAFAEGRRASAEQ